MLRWFRKILSPSVVAKAPDHQKQVGDHLRAEDVMDVFLEQNPKPTPFMVHALVAAGGANLPDSDAVVRVCEKIEHHGYQYPLNPTLRRQLKYGELLLYLKWHASRQINRESYRDENSIVGLIERFRKECGSAS